MSRVFLLSAATSAASPQPLFMAYRFPLCYNMDVARPYTELVRGCFIVLKNTLNFLKAVMASVVSYYLCKWLDCLFQIMSN